MGFGSLDTAVMGINAQAKAIGHISDNVANATTNGYKTVNTYFSDLVFNKLRGDSPVIDSNRNMGVLANADFQNRAQGTLIRDGSTSSIAITGNGFIPVARATGVANGAPTGFEETLYLTRLGDFHMDNSNRLVNSAGYYLLAVETGETTPSDFVVDTSDIPAIPTTTVDYTINLPATALPGKEITTGIGVVDSESEERNFQVQWTKTAADTWDMTINTDGGTPASFGPVTVTFTNSTLTTMTTADTNLTVTGSGAATVTLNVDYGNGGQAIALNLGTFGATFDVSASSSLTQYPTTDREPSNVNLTQNGRVGGAFDYVTFDEDGQIIYNYENGRSQVGGQLMLGLFNEPDRLDRVDGTTYRMSNTDLTGNVVFGAPNGTSGAGKITAGALEQSTVDIADQMTRLIVAQQAYSMNGQVITASDQMWSRAIDMKK